MPCFAKEHKGRTVYRSLRLGGETSKQATVAIRGIPAEAKTCAWDGFVVVKHRKPRRFVRSVLGVVVPAHGLGSPKKDGWQTGFDSFRSCSRMRCSLNNIYPSLSI
mmetsp:Transcript_26993/g.57801  ORF Transcript_26993/g.57801 Transcript_26993/m.57801 type:complete len:106 (-) Transcript_26993:814-1131(-)